jgi:hypothetical protein
MVVCAIYLYNFVSYKGDTYVLYFFLLLENEPKSVI